MNEVVDHIDAQYLSLYPEYKFWGLSEIVTKAKDRFPVQCVPVNGNREKVCLDDSYDCVVWHRQISATRIENEEESFGLVLQKEFNVILRTIVAYKIELGEEFMFDFIDNFPNANTNSGSFDSTFDITFQGLSGYLVLDAEPGDINLDHEAIARDEEIHTQYNQHRICWNIFTFDNTFRFILCPVASP